MTECVVHSPDGVGARFELVTDVCSYPGGLARGRSALILPGVDTDTNF
jgi:hypothetical protein